MGTKECVHRRKEVNSHRTGLGHQHDGYSFMLRLRQIDLLFHIIVIECPYSCIPCLPCIPMYTLCSQRTSKNIIRKRVLIQLEQLELLTYLHDVASGF